MLTDIYIKNYAIIDDLHITFNQNLNIITGETGAGKSIVLGALSLVLGGRADSSSFIDVSKKCIIEAHFNIEKKIKLQQWLTQHLDDNDNLSTIILRREYHPQTKVSRSFINDCVAPLQTIKECAALLIDLHRQFDTLEINDKIFQINVIDALAENANLLQQYTKIYKLYIDNKKQLQQALADKNNQTKELEYYSFLAEELNHFNAKPNELEHIEQQLKLYHNSERILETCNDIVNIGAEKEDSILQLLKQFSSQLKKIDDATLHQIAQRIDTVRVELNDIINEITTIKDKIDTEASTNDLEERLSQGFRLLKKHQVNNTNELIEKHQFIQQKLSSITNIEDTIIAYQKTNDTLKIDIDKLAKEISVKRIKTSDILSQQVTTLLHRLGMPNAVFKIDIKTLSDINEYGVDDVQFLLDANKANKFEALKNVSSGGELSRLMLSIKSLVASKLELPVLVFDEIDTGVSGEVAKQIGLIFKNISNDIQIIAITHQPSIAVVAQSHFFIYKKEINQKINTHIRLLTHPERVQHIAEMLGGNNPSAAILKSAEEMLTAH